MTSPISSTPENTPPKRKLNTQRPVLVITLYNWFIPILILLIFTLGIVLGYFLHPSSSSPTAQLEPQQTPTAVGLSAEQRQHITDLIAQQTLYYQGSPNATVLMFEFGDFQ